MASLVVRPEAEADLFEAAIWYEGERAGLGEELVNAVRATFTRVEDLPLQFPIVMQSVRRALVHRFPYAVFFTLDDHRATVIAVMHLHRSPHAWKRRA